MNPSETPSPGPRVAAAGVPPAVYLGLLLEAAKDYAIFGLDRERRVTMWSTGAEAIFGYSEAEMIGQTADVIFTAEDRASGAPVAEADRALRAGRSADERWHRRKSGERFFAFGMMMVLRDPRGEQLGFVKIARDLTERKRLEEQLLASHDELERSVQARTRELEQLNTSLRDEIARRTAAERQREQWRRRVATAEEQERLRVAREIHDELGQHIAALMMRLNALDLALAGSAPRALVADAQQLAGTIGRKLHEVAVQLRPSALDDLGLPAAVSAYVEVWSARSGVPVHMEVVNFEGAVVRRDVELVLYRIVQEALTNILKHAAASRVSLVLMRTDGEISLVIEDDGRGFDPDAAAGDASGGLGLVGIEERVALVGGRVAVESQPGQGTTVFVRIPR